MQRWLCIIGVVAACTEQGMEPDLDPGSDPDSTAVPDAGTGTGTGTDTGTGANSPDTSVTPRLLARGETVFTQGDDPSSPFFAELGTNLRTCATCHDRDAGWSITPAALRARFD